MRDLTALLEALPDQLARRAVTHASWTSKRQDSYERLAFLGDSVLSLSITTHLWSHPAAIRRGPGRLTKMRAQAVSGRACRAVGERLGLPERLAGAYGGTGQSVETLLEGERVLAEMVEAVIGACYLEFGFDETAAAVVDAFAPEIQAAVSEPMDFERKSALQERLARRGAEVTYDVVSQEGPAHDPTYVVAAVVDGEEAGRGAGRSRKEAEQAAAGAALEALPD